MSTYGLNNPDSPNYIADLGERIKVAAELQTLAKTLGTTVTEYLASL